MHAPAFSIFSAVSELFVTAGVIYVLRTNWMRRPFNLGIFLTVALFEACVNVMYMANRSAQVASAGEVYPPLMKIGFAVHGLLSLLAYLVFVVLGVFAWQEQKQGRWFFRERPALTWTFSIAWAISILSGEALFAWRYLF